MVAFTLSLVGLSVQVVVALLVGAFVFGMFGSFGGTSNMMGGMMGTYHGGTSGMMGSYSPWVMSGSGWFTWMWIPILAVPIAVGAVGCLMLNRSELQSVRTGSVLVFIAAILAFPTAWGLFVGSLLMLVGSILGLTWSPLVQKTNP